MNSNGFDILYHKLSRKMAADKKLQNMARTIRIQPGCLGNKQTPAIIIDTVQQSVLTIHVYYPLWENEYYPALRLQSLTRCNMAQQHKSRKCLYAYGIDRLGKIMYLYVSVTVPAPPDDQDTLYQQLFSQTDLFAANVGIQFRGHNTM